MSVFSYARTRFEYHQKVCQIHSILVVRQLVLNRDERGGQQTVGALIVVGRQLFFRFVGAQDVIQLLL